MSKIVAWSPRLTYPGYEKARHWANGQPSQQDVDYWKSQNFSIDLAYSLDDDCDLSVQLDEQSIRDMARLFGFNEYEHGRWVRSTFTPDEIVAFAQAIKPKQATGEASS